jgi:DNA polymerase-2
VDAGFIVHATERTRSGRTEIHLFGRLANGDTFAVIERRRLPSFFVRESDEQAARGAVALFPTDRTTMDGERVLRVETRTSSQAQKIRDELHRAGVRTYEADVKLSTHYLMDNRLHGGVAIEGSWRPGRRVARIYEDPALSPSSSEPRLTTLSLDLETDAKADTVYSAALVCTDATGAETCAEVLFNGAAPAPYRSYPGEAVMLAALRDRIVELDPDIITGWNIVDFDIRVLARRFAAHGIAFDIGRSDAAASFLDRDDPDGITKFRRSKAIVPGRQVVDGLWLTRMAGMGLEDYRLETVAQSVLGRGKRIDELPGETRTAAVERLYRNDPGSLCAYCLEDTRLALEILQREGLLDIAIRKSMLIGTSLEQTSMSVAAFEFLYMEHLHQRGMAAPTLGIDQDELGRAPGGGIITPRAGLFRNVLAFDFKSLYPSIMRTFNIDPLSRIRPGTAGATAAGAPGAALPRVADATAPLGGATAPITAPITAPNGAMFARTPGILPDILDRFFASRAEARTRGDTRAVYAYKIVMNSFYGVLGTPGCRFAASALAGAITTFGQHILFWARDLVTAQGMEVIYGDTDSLFVLSGADRDLPAADLASQGAAIAEMVNKKLTEYVRDTYAVESRMELEFEAVYRRLFMPPMRTGAIDESDDEPESRGRGRAKGYAGLQVSANGVELLEVKGLEAIRHDWTPLAQELQLELLDRVFHDAAGPEIGDRVRSLLRELRAGRRDGKLAYRKYLRKPVDAYTKSSPPHARAAALLPPEERTGLIRYVWTTEGPQPEGRLTALPDYEHYVQKQVRPIVESIAPFVGLATEDMFAAGGQLVLF